jgi:hypothetical protein
VFSVRAPHVPLPLPSPVPGLPTACAQFISCAVLADDPSAIKTISAHIPASSSPAALRRYQTLISYLCKPEHVTALLRILQHLAPVGVRPTVSTADMLCEAAASRWRSARAPHQRCPACASSMAGSTFCSSLSASANVGEWIVQPSRMLEFLRDLNIQVRVCCTLCVCAWRGDFDSMVVSVVVRDSVGVSARCG